MKFLSMTITLSKSQYVITSRPTLWQKLSVLLKILLIVALSLHAGFEHISYTIARRLSRQVEKLAINLMSGLIAPKGVYA